MIRCPLIAGPRVAFVFRAADGTRLASASAPTVGKAWICSTISFSIHGKAQTALVDSSHGRGFVYRVQRLLGVKLRATPGSR